MVPLVFMLTGFDCTSHLFSITACFSDVYRTLQFRYLQSVDTIFNKEDTRQQMHSVNLTMTNCRYSTLLTTVYVDTLLTLLPLEPSGTGLTLGFYPWSRKLESPFSVLPSPFKPGGPPGLILEKLQATWLEKDAAIHEDTVLCNLHFFVFNFCMLKGLVSPKWSINISI